MDQKHTENPTQKSILDSQFTLGACMFSPDTTRWVLRLN